MSSCDKLMEIYGLLLERYGEQGWWPGESRIEIIVGAILTQNTNWGNVEKAINNLKEVECLDVESLYKIEIERLAELIRPAGYYNIKAKRLKNFMNWLESKYGLDLYVVSNVDTWTLREQLLSIKGVGRETADSILLYGFEREVFVVDAYTCRIMCRHGLIDREFDYEQVREFFESNLDNNSQLFNEYHALLVQVGKNHCKVKPKCEGCPLEGLERYLELEDY